MVYLRLLLTTSIISHNISSEDIPHYESSHDGNKTQNHYSFLTFRKNVTNNQYHQTSTNAFRYHTLSLGIGICTLCLGGYAAYQQRLQTSVAQEVNNYEMTRQNDFEEVSQGLMFKDNYTKKYSKTK